MVIPVMKGIAPTCNIFFLPKISAAVPVMSVATVQPPKTADIINEVSLSVRNNCFFIKRIVPEIAPMSKPYNNPPKLVKIIT